MPVFDAEKNILTLEFEVYCHCGNGLYGQYNVGHTRRRGMPFITIEPCPYCLEEEYKEGFLDGYQEACDTVNLWYDPREKCR